MGHSRRLLAQAEVGLVLAARWPLTRHVWQGKPNDVTTLPEVFDVLVRRFGFSPCDSGGRSRHGQRAPFASESGRCTVRDSHQRVRQGHTGGNRTPQDADGGQAQLPESQGRVGIGPKHQQCECRLQGHICVPVPASRLPGSARLRLRRYSEHIGVTALALLVQWMPTWRLSDAKCGLSAADALRALETVPLVGFEVDGHKSRGRTTLSPQARQVLNALGITKLDPPDPPAGPPEAA